MTGTIAFILGLGALLSDLILRKRIPRIAKKVNIILTAGAVLALAVWFILRSIALRFPALTSTYEALLFFSFLLFCGAFGLIIRDSIFSVYRGIVVMALFFLVLASSPLFSQEARPPIPALQSGWLVVHVALAFIGETFFAAAFIISCLWFCAGKNEERRARLDRLSFRCISLGYPFFTIGALIFGAIWAASAWGRFWSWDPKETWALATCLVYTFYLHGRLIRKDSPRLLHLISVCGFVLTMFTFLGVRFLGSSSLHGY